MADRIARMAAAPAAADASRVSLLITDG